MRESADRIRREKTTPLSPRTALRRILVLSEGRQFREASTVLNRLGPNALSIVASELPLELLIEGLPHSAQLLEIFFKKLVAAGQRGIFNAEPVLWNIVRLLATQDEFGLRFKVSRVAQSVVEFQPDLYNIIYKRKKTIDQVVQGLGCHGLTTTTSGLTPLHLALKTELLLHIETYKCVLHRLEELGVSMNSIKKPVDSSHQRLLSLNFDEVQKRLIDNKTLLNMIDKPDLKQLPSLIKTLADRVENDKEVLFCVSQLKRLQIVDEEKPVASILMSFSRGCQYFLEMVKLSESSCSSDGYHSESEQENENGEDAVSRYATLYYQNRPRVLEALDSVPDLKYTTLLKAKIVFSVVVLSFRSCKSLRDSKIRETMTNFHVNPQSLAGNRLRSDIMRCFLATYSSFPLDKIEHQVLSLVADTLKEYRSLESCLPLKKFIGVVTRVCWYLVNHEPLFELDADFQAPAQYQPERHQRHHSSDRLCNIIRFYLWPGLIRDSKYVYKSVVITN